MSERNDGARYITGAEYDADKRRWREGGYLYSVELSGDELVQLDRMRSEESIEIERRRIKKIIEKEKRDGVHKDEQISYDLRRFDEGV